MLCKVLTHRIPRGRFDVKGLQCQLLAALCLHFIGALYVDHFWVTLFQPCFNENTARHATAPCPIAEAQILQMAKPLHRRHA